VRVFLECSRKLLASDYEHEYQYHNAPKVPMPRCEIINIIINIELMF